MPSGTLLLCSPLLAPGGMELQLLELARAAARHGRRVMFLSGPGALEPLAREVAEVEIVDWSRPRVETARRARALVGPAGTAVMAADPVLLHLIVPLAAAGSLHLCMHNRPGTFEIWFNAETLARFRALVPRLHDSGRVAFTASSMRGVRGHAPAFGLPEQAISPWYPGLDAPAGDDAVAAGPVARVAVVSRFSPEKLAILAAGAELVAAGRAVGAAVTLDVHGDGPAEPDARALLAARLPADAFRLHGPTSDPFGAIAGADVVVNSGRAAIEGLLLGKRVVCARIADGPAGLGPVVLADDFAALREDNFAWGGPPQDPAATWARVAAMTAGEIAAVREDARRQLSGEALYQAHLAAVARTDAASPPGPSLLEGATELALALEDAYFDVKAVADHLWAERYG